MEEFWSGGLFPKEDDTSPTVDVLVKGEQISIVIFKAHQKSDVASLFNLTREQAQLIAAMLNEAVCHSEDWSNR